MSGIDWRAVGFNFGAFIYAAILTGAAALILWGIFNPRRKLVNVKHRRHHRR